MTISEVVNGPKSTEQLKIDNLKKQKDKAADALKRERARQQKDKALKKIAKANNSIMTLNY